MWNRSNRIINETERIKVTNLIQDHLKHMLRLYNTKPAIEITAPRKPKHLKKNLKKDQQDLERQCEI